MCCKGVGAFVEHNTAQLFDLPCRDRRRYNLELGTFFLKLHSSISIVVIVFFFE